LRLAGVDEAGAVGKPRHRRDALGSTPEWLRIGDCVVDVPLREVLPPGVSSGVRVTPKAIGVLLALAEANGRPVSRDVLLERVWPNTLPTGDVVTQAIVQLRKALADERAVPYIITINRTGYRLTVPAEWLDIKPASSSSCSRDGSSTLEARTGRLIQGADAMPVAVLAVERRQRLGFMGRLMAIALLAATVFAAISSVT
jgi:DNA-binding winged helix-turn-helix (wHTH) protein